ncbi:MAG: hypothetical protein M3044_05950 [Thermoproteota archaeon]|nr:hypothetical protein [Thermoproteota archaeon]
MSFFLGVFIRDNYAYTITIESAAISKASKNLVMVCCLSHNACTGMMRGTSTQMSGKSGMMTSGSNRGTSGSGRSTSGSGRSTSGSSNNGAMMSSNKMLANNSSIYGAVLRPLKSLLLIKLHVRSQEKIKLV